MVFLGIARWYHCTCVYSDSGYPNRHKAKVKSKKAKLRTAQRAGLIKEVFRRDRTNGTDGLMGGEKWGGERGQELTIFD
jgi:hypothetical protein